MGEWLPTPPNGHPSGRLPDEFLAENPRAQYDHTVSDWERKFSDPNVVKLRSQLKSQDFYVWGKFQKKVAKKVGVHMILW